MNKSQQKPYIQIDYSCDKGMLAQIIIPKNATPDDLSALRELLEVIIKRRYKESEDTE
jgi:hypothetical protein